MVISTEPETPNELLADIRGMIQEYPDNAYLAMMLRFKFSQLDEILSNGGPPPDDWLWNELKKNEDPEVEKIIAAKEADIEFLRQQVIAAAEQRDYLQATIDRAEEHGWHRGFDAARKYPAPSTERKT